MSNHAFKPYEVQTREPFPVGARLLNGLIADGAQTRWITQTKHHYSSEAVLSAKSTPGARVIRRTRNSYDIHWSPKP